MRVCVTRVKFKVAPDKAKLERAKPPLRINTISQGGRPRSKEESVMHVAGDKKAIVWQSFRTWIPVQLNDLEIDVADCEKAHGIYPKGYCSYRCGFNSI